MTELVGTDVGARGDARGLVAHEAACTPQIAVAKRTRVVRRDGRIFVDIAHHAYEAIADAASPVGAARRARRLWLVVEDGVYLRLADRIDLVPGGVAWARGARGSWKEPIKSQQNKVPAHATNNTGQTTTGERSHMASGGPFRGCLASGGS